MWWKFGENRFSGSWDNLSERYILKKETSGCTPLPFLNYGVTEQRSPNLHTHNVARSSQVYLLDRNGDTPSRFGMPRQRWKWFCRFHPFWLQNWLPWKRRWAIWKGGQIGNLRSKTCLLCSFAILDPRVGHTIDVLSVLIYLCLLSFWLTLPRRVLSTQLFNIRSLYRFKQHVDCLFVYFMLCVYYCFIYCF